MMKAKSKSYHKTSPWAFDSFMKIRRISLTKEALLKMAPPDRDFLLLAGHIQNELNSLHKVFTWCLQNRSLEDSATIENIASRAQAMIYARLLAGKLCEARQVLDISFFGTKLSHRIEPRLHPNAQAALSRIKRYFGRANTIYKVRNSFAFHYSADEFSLHWEAAINESSFEVIAGGTVGNNLYLASELVANTAMLSNINPINLEDALGSLFNDTQSMASQFADFLEGAIVAILEEQFGSGLSGIGQEEVILPTHKFSEVSIPYFCVPDDRAKNA
ncbi:MAG: hypothetical protein K2Y07_07415 [Nitrosomonas sp.]|nr:hypothetical protein [Nitrosomonas sp.]